MLSEEISSFFPVLELQCTQSLTIALIYGCCALTNNGVELHCNTLKKANKWARSLGDEIEKKILLHFGEEEAEMSMAKV